MSKKISFGNFKGGTGKTTNSCMISYNLAKKGYKTLLIDLDPQANATTLFLLTAQQQLKSVVNFKTTLMTAISEDIVPDIITEIMPNLFLLPSFADFTSFPLYLEQKFPEDPHNRSLFFKRIVDQFDHEFDFIIFDIPPTLSVYTDSAILASDYVVIVLQTQERSLVGAQAFIAYLQELIDTYHNDINILGILPVLLNNRAIVDASILNLAEQYFGKNNLFDNVVKNMERIKRFDMTGITDPEINGRMDMHDLKVHKLYDIITSEMLERLRHV